MSRRKQGKTTPTKWRDRIIGLEYHHASELADHPQQWRVHPSHQIAALHGILSEIGIAGALLAYHSANADGALVKIDGHARASLDPATPWPTLILDLSDAEAALLLATYDPLAGLAEANLETLAGLLQTVSTGEAALQAMLGKFAEQEGIVPEPFERNAPDGQGRLDEHSPITCPACGATFVP